MSRRAKLSLTQTSARKGAPKEPILYPTQTLPVSLRTHRFSRILFALAFVAATLLTFASAHPAAAAGTHPATRTLSARETTLLNHIQSVRRAAGLATLTLDNRLIDLARDRSADMANRRYFDHYTPEGRTFLDMMRQRGIPFRMAGEIIAQNNYQGAQTAEQAYQAFMSSSEHHRIIMMSNWRTVGLGQSVDGNGMYYYTVLFSQPR
jgi:uncharacterized protein YkwD